MSLGSYLYTTLGQACDRVVKEEVENRGILTYKQFKKMSKHTQQEIMCKMVFKFMDLFLENSYKGIWSKEDFEKGSAIVQLPSD